MSDEHSAMMAEIGARARAAAAELAYASSERKAAALQAAAAASEGIIGTPNGVSNMNLSKSEGKAQTGLTLQNN